jgi:MoaA/NifB/PqqE/SkfB family radical SAM enzyme
VKARLGPSLDLLHHGLSYLARLRQGRREAEAHLSHPERVGVPAPSVVQLRITNLCNLRCRMCGQWGDTGQFLAHEAGDAEHELTRQRVGLDRQLSLREYESLLDQLVAFDPIVSLFGGEPLLYPDIVPLVRAAKQRGLKVTMITNGWFLEKFAADLVEAGMDSVAVSVDGPPDVHDRIRGQPGSFARLAAGLRALEAERQARGRGVPLAVAIYPITELNLSHAQAGIEALQQLPLHGINVGLRWFVPSAVGAEYEKVMREELGSSAESWKGFEFAWPEQGPLAAEGDAMRGLVDWLETRHRDRIFDTLRGRPWVTFIPKVAAKDVPAYFTDFGRTFGHDFCPVAWYFAQVGPDGEVVFCGDFPDYSIGNVRKEPFLGLWNGARAAAFRTRLKRAPLPICSRCCGSYVYGRWERPAST